MDCKLLELNTRETPCDGALSFFEGARDVPFEIKRIYYIYGAPEGTQRGGHAHRALRQLLFCPYGSVRLRLFDGRETKEILLDTPQRGLLLGPGIWRDMFWQKTGSVLCVAASEYYTPEDYIRDYDAFLRFAAESAEPNA